MKIAIMTQPLGKNYGGIMQAWALQQVLKRMGHEVVTIDRQPDQPTLAYMAARLGYRAAMKAIGRRKAPINFEKHLPIILQHTQAFIAEHITMSEPLYSTQQLRAHFDRENYDAVIVGSDQTWRPKYSPNIYNFFLDFLEDKEILRIAYASSFGVNNWEYSEEQTKRCAELAKKFDSISVREKSGVDLCHKYLGVAATHALDPTLLLNKDSYIKLLDKKSINSNHSGVYSYILDRTTEKKHLVDQYSKSLNANAFTAQADIDLYHWSANDISKYVMPPPKEWIEGFAKGSLVITDSFHGTAFSIIFQKPFLAAVNAARGADRFTSLTRSLGLEHHLINIDTSFQNYGSEVAIDWSAVTMQLNAFRRHSMNHLSQSLASNESGRK
ncbi:polysaccharide pyruvyl transferase family protein [Stutzerimonas chloritidismutans]|uniref:polysaccharide pyruvyl transferase family protein n=1 Tax=Gammaproteobacteria TaxID=1236 RepID=UPI00384C38D7